MIDLVLFAGRAVRSTVETKNISKIKIERVCGAQISSRFGQRGELRSSGGAFAVTTLDRHERVGESDVRRVFEFIIEPFRVFLVPTAQDEPDPVDNGWRNIYTPFTVRNGPGLDDTRSIEPDSSVFSVSIAFRPIYRSSRLASWC